MIRQGVYKHYKGDLYTVLFAAVSANNADDRRSTVVYVSHTTGQVYTRDAGEFFGKNKDGIDRFQFVAHAVGPPVRL